MLILSKEDIQKVISMKEVIEYDKEAMRMDSEGKSKVPLRTNIEVDKGSNIYMPAYVPEIDASGVKIVSTFPDNPKVGKPTTTAQVLMLDEITGEVSAIMNGTYLTQLRTGAIQGAATDILAKKDAKKAVLIGAGGQAESQLEAMLTVRDLIEVAVVDLDEKLVDKFIKKMNKIYTNVKIYRPENQNDAIKQADIITTVTTSPEAVFDGSLIKKGCHVNGIGSYIENMKETPSQAFTQADILVVDTYEGVFSEAGDVIKVLEDELVNKDDFIELGELVKNPNLGRTNDEQITVFNSVGTAVLDIVVAAKILEKAQKKNVGTVVEL